MQMVTYPSWFSSVVSVHVAAVTVVLPFVLLFFHGSRNMFCVSYSCFSSLLVFLSVLHLYHWHKINFSISLCALNLSHGWLINLMLMVLHISPAIFLNLLEAKPLNVWHAYQISPVCVIIGIVGITCTSCPRLIAIIIPFFNNYCCLFWSFHSSCEQFHHKSTICKINPQRVYPPDK